MIAEQLTPRDVSRIYAWHGMIYEQVYIEIGDPRSLRHGSVGLPKFVAPLVECLAALLMFYQVTADAIGWKQPILPLRKVEHAPETDNAYQTSKH